MRHPFNDVDCEGWAVSVFSFFFFFSEAGIGVEDSSEN